MSESPVTGQNASSGGGGAPTGAAGGELAGTYPNPTVKDAVIDDANIVAGGLTNAAIAAAAAIAKTKISGTAITAADTGTVTSAMITDGTIVTGDLNAAAGITSGQLAGSIAPSKITGTAVVATDTVNTLTAPAADFSMNTHKITNLTNGSGAQDAAAFGQIPVAGAVGGPAKWVIRTANSSTITSQGTLQNDDTLLWAVGASDRWFFEAWLFFTAANSSGSATTEDAQVGFSVPATGTMNWGQTGGNSASFGGYNGGATGATTLPMATEASTLQFGALAGSFGVVIGGFYTGGGTSGTVTLKWSQAVSNAATLLIGKDSALRLTRIA